MSRTRIKEFSRQFADLHSGRRDLALSTDDLQLNRPAKNSDSLWPTSPAIMLVRSAAIVEQMVNGLTVRLWDDPFEWTLPERLPTAGHLTAYFDEVEEARIRGFEYLRDDSDLERSIPAPVKLKTLDQLLFDTLTRSEQFLSTARTMLRNGDRDH